MDASNAKRIGAALLTISALYGAYRLLSGDSPKQAVSKAIDKPVQMAHKIVKEAIIDVAEKLVELKPIEAAKELVSAPVEVAKEIIKETPVEKILPPQKPKSSKKSKKKSKKSKR